MGPLVLPALVCSSSSSAFVEQALVLLTLLLFNRQVWGSDMSSQETPQARRFPIEAGDSPSLATAPETQEPVAPERAATRQLRRCPGCHCLTLPNVPIDVYIAMGGSHRPRTT
ncbi:hypothetical protein Chor_001771 [Crotalus horridus]